ncbi:DNA repair protein RecN [Roseateles saccharophilus]|uniref:DNA repair protein RecN n=1 Tax=Roseateles saccharophilus TaxID=304 RepID=A0A4R3UTV1_ROSSA|nr:DNA repair protein RecN [Roseateles saccharophilus]MDG0833288.1 DNA repair protein RecN [Roseateles saccharophilus]TCU94361.1 DNA replication and repair protein RecN [Roseateles saccharophilus]
MLRHLSLKDFVIVPVLELDFEAGFAVLTGETGAGKSILIDALQLALGGRGDAGVVREGAARAEICAEFDTPAHLRGWLDEAGFEPDDALLLRRVIDAAGKSRAWINGGAATLTQLRELADHLLDIHGQHAWQGLTRPAAVRELLDGFAGLDSAPLARAHAAWKQAADTLQKARGLQAEAQRERERLAWQIGELDGLAPAEGEWAELNAEHERLSHGQSLIDAAKSALNALDDAEPSAQSLAGQALDLLERVLDFDARLLPAVQALRDAQAQLQDASHTLATYLHKTDLDPDRLAELDERVSAWMTLARRYRRQPQDLPALLAQWRAELAALDAASDPARLEAALAATRQAFDAEAQAASRARKKAAPQLAAAVTAAMQQLGMAGGRFDIALQPADGPQSYGAESAEFLVAGHAGSTPRPLAKVASGGELSRIALAIAVTSSQAASAQSPGTLIFDEIDVGIGGAVAETVGRLMKQLGRERQVMAVTHLPQVAACADRHLVVAKSSAGGATASSVSPVAGEARVAEIARMLGGEHLSSTSLAHAEEMLAASATTSKPKKARS